MSRRFPYILNRKGHYHFRMAVPTASISSLGRKEITYSLNTKDLNEARKRSLCVLNVISEALTTLPNTDPVSNYYHLVAKLNALNYSPSKIITQRNAAIINVLNPASTQPIISALFQSYLSECQGDKPRTILQKEALFTLWLDAMGDFPAPHLNKAHARDFKNLLMKLPSNMRKRYKGVKLQSIDLEKIEPDKRLSIATINLALSHMNAFTNWMIKNGHYEAANPFYGLALKQNEKAIDKKHAFSRDQLKAIFCSPLFIGCMSDKLHDRFISGDLVIKDGFYWVTLIALFSGARMQEICQMHVTDVHKVDNVWVFDFNDNADDKELKTLSSKRKVPIHPYLIELGLLEHIERQTQLGHKRLFPDLPMGSNGTYSSVFSKRFSYFLKRIGLKTNKISFHSFRHTFIDALRNSDVPREVREALVGHSSYQTAHDNYGSPMGVKKLMAGIIQLPYGNSASQNMLRNPSLNGLFQ